MRHDPLCEANEYGETYDCDCRKIRRVREDERSKAVWQRDRLWGEGYAAALRDVFGFHPEWTVTGMCKPDCPACLRLTELINERSEGYKEALRDAVDAVKALPPVRTFSGDPAVRHDEAVAAIEALGGER